MGLGFNLTAKDDGLSETAEKSTDSLQKLMGVVDSLGERAVKMGGLATQGRELTTGFEAMLLQNRKSVKALSFQMGVWGDKADEVVKKAQGMSLAIGVSAEHAAEATIEYKKGLTSFNAVGIMSAEDLAKATEVLGVKATFLREQLNSMSQVTGIKTPKAMKKLVGSFMLAGKQIGDVSGSFQQLEETMNTLRTRSAQVGAMTEDQMAALGGEVAVLTAGLSKMGVKGEEAKGFASDLFTKMTEGAAHFQQIFSGTQNDIPKLAESLAITTGQVDESFSLMQQGPQGFMSGMAKLVKSAKDKLGPAGVGKVMKFMTHQMNEALGPDMATKLSNYLSNASDEALETMAEVSKGAAGLKDARDHYIDPRGLDERMALAEEAFRTRLRDLNKTGEKYLADTQASFKVLGDELTRLGQDKGPVGSLTRTLVDLDQKGLVGLLPDRLQGMAAALGKFATTIGNTLKKITSPLDLFESGMMTFGIAMTDAYLHAGQVFNKTTGKWEGTINTQLGFFDRFKIALKSVGNDIAEWFEALPKKVSDGLDSILKTLTDWLKPGGKSDSNWKAGVMGWWKRMTESFSKLFSPENRKKLSDIWELIAPELKKGWDSLVAEVDGFVKDFWEGFTNALDPENSKKPVDGTVGGFIGDALGGVWKWVKESVWPKITKFVGDFWKELTNSLSSDPDKVASPNTVGGKIGKWLGDALKTGFDKLGDMLPGLIGDLLWAIAKAFGRIPGNVIQANVEAYKAGFEDIKNKIKYSEDPTDKKSGLKYSDVMKQFEVERERKAAASEANLTAVPMAAATVQQSTTSTALSPETIDALTRQKGLIDTIERTSIDYAQVAKSVTEGMIAALRRLQGGQGAGGLEYLTKPSG